MRLLEGFPAGDYPQGSGLTPPNRSMLSRRINFRERGMVMAKKAKKKKAKKKK
jgi:hypothetical protein